MTRAKIVKVLIDYHQKGPPKGKDLADCIITAYDEERKAISTSDLIAELERRRPCDRCKNKALKWYESYCTYCRWAGHIGDNYKEVKP